MTNESFLAIACVGVIAMFFGFVLAFAGYRFFLILLPIWGFFFGFGLGAQTIQAIFGTGFLSEVTSWVVGFVVAVIFAVLAYLFYLVAVAIIAGSLGYLVGVGVMEAIGFDFNFIVWLVGIILAVIVAVAVLRFNIQKWVIIIATAVAGAAVIVGAFLYIFGGLPSAQIAQNPVRLVLQTNPFWAIIFIVVAVLGFVAQYRTSQRWKLETYNRWDEMNTAPTM